MARTEGAHVSRHRKNAPLLILLTVIAGLSTGCMRAASMALAEVRGASARLYIVSEQRDADWSTYQSIEFSPATSDSGSTLCPATLLQKYDRAASEHAEKLRDEYPGGEPALRVSSRIIFFQKKGILAQAECLARVAVRGTSGTLLDAFVKAESKSFTRGGESALSEACVKEVADYLAARKPREDKRGDRE
jgi:hypothetical protein